MRRSFLWCRVLGKGGKGGARVVEQWVWYLYDEEAGQGMVEYGLVIALVALALVVGIQAVGAHPMSFFEEFVVKFRTLMP